jgi:hypothetical protein
MAACAPPRDPRSASAPARDAEDHASCEAAPAPAAAPVSAAAPPTVDLAAEATLPPPAIVLGEASPAPSAAPSVRLTSPVAGAHVAPDAAARLDVSGWPTAEGAAHVHLILDNQPYKPIYDTGAPVPMRELNGGKDLAPGAHLLVAFASRANHESVKAASAITAVPFVVGDAPPAPPAPGNFLVFSRPKGTYAGPQANHVLVDFQLVGVALGPGKHAVGIEVSGASLTEPLRARATSFGPPFYLENLRSGSYTIALTLLDAAGKPVPGAWNATTRTIVIDRSKK